MLVFYSLIIKRQSVISVKLLLSVSFSLLIIFVFAPTKFCFFFFKYCCNNRGRSLCVFPAEAWEEKNFLAPSLTMIIGLPVTKPNLNIGFVASVAKWRADHPEGVVSSLPLLLAPRFLTIWGKVRSF